MMGVSVSAPSYIYGDNMSVIHNTQWPESTLKKKSNSMRLLPCRAWISSNVRVPHGTYIDPWQSRRYLHEAYPRWYEAWPSRWSSALRQLRSSLICSYLNRVNEGYKVPLSLCDRISGLRWHNN
jgi:hypothetical protein